MNPITASFNTTVKQITKMSQQKKKTQMATERTKKLLIHKLQGTTYETNLIQMMFSPPIKMSRWNPTTPYFRKQIPQKQGKANDMLLHAMHVWLTTRVSSFQNLLAWKKAFYS